MSGSLGTNIIKLLSSKIAVQIVTLVTAPIMARIFLPEHYGVVQMYSSISSIIIVISCLRYELSIPLGKDRGEVLASFVLSISLAFAFALIVLALVPFMKGKIAYWLKSPELEKFLWILPLSVFMSGLGAALRYNASYKGRFGAIAWADISSAITNIFFVIPWALIIGASAVVLFTGSIISIILGVLVLSAFLSRSLISDIKITSFNPKLVWTIAKSNKKFPIFDTWSGLLNTVSHNLPVFMLGAYFSKTVVGYYSLGDRMVHLPFSLLSLSISQVFFPTAAKEYNESQTLSIVGTMFKRLVQISVFPMVIIAFLGKPLFGFVFGEHWLEAGIYAQILSGYVIFQFLSSPLSSVLAILQLQGIALLWHSGFAFSKFAGLIIGAKIGGPRIALALYSAFSMIAYSILMVWILHKSRFPLQLAFKLVLRYLCLSLLLVVPVFCLAWFLKMASITFISLGLAILVYMWFMYRFDLNIRNNVNSFMLRLLRPI